MLSMEFQIKVCVRVCVCGGGGGGGERGCKDTSFKSMANYIRVNQFVNLQSIR